MVATAMMAACARCRAMLFMVLLLPFEWTTRIRRDGERPLRQAQRRRGCPFDKLRSTRRMPDVDDRCPWFRPLRMRGAAHPGDLWTRLAPGCPGAAATRTTPINTLIRKDCRANATVGAARHSCVIRVAPRRASSRDRGRASAEAQLRREPAQSRKRLPWDRRQP